MIVAHTHPTHPTPPHPTSHHPTPPHPTPPHTTPPHTTPPHPTHQVLIATDSTRVSEVSALWVTIALRCLRSTKKNPDHDEMREMGLLMIQEGVRMAKTR